MPREMRITSDSQIRTGLGKRNDRISCKRENKYQRLPSCRTLPTKYMLPDMVHMVQSSACCTSHEDMLDDKRLYTLLCTGDLASMAACIYVHRTDFSDRGVHDALAVLHGLDQSVRH